MVRRKTVPRENYDQVSRQLLALQSASEAITSSLDLQLVLDTVAREMCRFLEVPACTLSEWNRGENVLQLMLEFGPEGWWSGSDGNDYSLKDYPLTLQALEEKEAVQLTISQENLDPAEAAFMEEAEITTLVMVPMVYQDTSVGLVVLMDNGHERTFSSQDIATAQYLANLAAIAIQNARLYEQAQAEIEEKKQVTEALSISEERYALAVQGSEVGIWDWNLKTGKIFLSSRWWALVGDQGASETQPEEWLQRVHPSDRNQLQLDLDSHIQGMTDHFENEHRLRHANGTYRWVLARGLAIREETGEAYRLAGSMSDITDQKQAEKQLIYDAFHDSLTGLPNRALFLDRLDRALARTKRRGENDFAILFLDLDRFKVINDSMGHTMGDKLLISVARRLEISLRAVDTVARLGGDEFVILLEDIPELDLATRVTERILEDLKKPFNLDGHEVFTSTSIGMVLSANGYVRPEDVLRDADIALYHAKARGRARFEIFDNDMRLEARARLTMENDLRRAIGNQEFRIHYQPIVSLSSGELMGFEALVRWPHPELGYIPPMDFIPVAEETSLIIPIDWWVLREACQQLKKWQEQYPREPALTMSVNLSSKHFSQFDLVQQVENILRVINLEPGSLILEITENAIIEHQASATKLITNLRTMGVQIQIDDFGTGYSSLGYLQKYPIDAIKIDRSFISKIGGKSTDIEIVRTILKLARELGLEAIAEGVETAEQLEQLQGLDCEFAQGYLFARPQEPGLAEAIIDETKSL